MRKDGLALPMGGFKIAVVGALLDDLDFPAYVAQLSVYFLLAFWTDAFGFAQSNTPIMPSTISASGNSIIDIVTKRSYLRIFAMVEFAVNKRIDE